MNEFDEQEASNRSLGLVKAFFAAKERHDLERNDGTVQRRRGVYLSLGRVRKQENWFTYGQRSRHQVNTYRKRSPLPRPRGAGYAVTVGDKICVIGGVCSSVDGKTTKPILLATPGGQTVTGFVDEYDPRTNTWKRGRRCQLREATT